MVRVGVIGCGKISQIRHIPEYAANADVKLIGFYDFVHERAVEMAEKYGGIAFSTLEELLASKEIDAVSVCTSNKTHAEVTVAALRRGMHVLCEKPMATTIEECNSMIRTAKEANKHLLIAHNQRLWNIHVKAKELIDSGSIGKPLTFQTTFGHGGPDRWSIDTGTGNWFFMKNQSAFGAMADLGIHKIDLIRYLLGQDMCEVQAMIGTLDKKDADGNPVSVEDNGLTIFRMDNGVMGSVTASWTNYGEESNDTVICGTEGCMKISVATRRIIIEKQGEETTILEFPEQTNSGIVDTFVNAIANDDITPIHADVVLPSMIAMLGAIESATTGRKINL